MRLPRWAILLAAFLVPGSGHVLLGRPTRGLVMLFWMVIFGYVTFRLAPPQTAFIARIGGGIAVWALSVVDAAHITALRGTKKEGGQKTWAR